MTGAGMLFWVQLRRDLGQILLWSLGIAVLYWSQAVSVESLYGTPQEFEEAAASMEGNAAFVAMTGPARALDTVGGQVTWQSAALGSVLVALMVMVLTGRNTRGAEESGRDELVRASPVGRYSVVTASVLEAMTASVVVGTAVAASLIAYPLAVADSLALGLGLALVGWCFTAVTLVAAQLTAGVRATYGLVGALLAAAYLLRAVGDTTGSWVSWASPIGWYQAMHAFSGVRWWPLVAPAAATAGGLVGAYVLLRHRDHGAGLLADRPGPSRAGRCLSGGGGLAWRLHRGSVAGWAGSLFAAGLAYGSIGDDVEDLLGDSEMGRTLLAGEGVDLVAAFQATSLLMLALIASGFTVSAALRMKSEEIGHRVDPLVAASLSRGRWWAGHALVNLAGSAVVLGAAGIGFGLGYGTTTGHWGRLAVLVPAQLAYLAPAMVLAAWSWVLYGLGTRWAVLAWTGPAVAVGVGYFGDLLDLPTWLQALSPYEHLAQVPSESFAWLPLLGTSVLALLLAVGGLWAFNARDLD
ncbi:hypothetical protein [Nocardioides sp.]|uniref:ABC transporter permease n=1 Tax=Nocardioides sp. TaxID=35761 RepID=UPI002D7EB874|nr:hypothetical protein [Nocardioides sp.]